MNFSMQNPIVSNGKIDFSKITPSMLYKKLRVEYNR